MERGDTILQKLKGNFEAGVKKLRWLSTVLNERLKVEAAVIKLLKEINDLEKKRDALRQSVGERVFELKDRQNPMRDAAIKEALGEIEKLEAEISDLRTKVSELGKVED